jgi:hypothetical protein
LFSVVGIGHQFAPIDRFYPSRDRERTSRRPNLAASITPQSSISQSPRRKSR